MVPEPDQAIQNSLGAQIGVIRPIARLLAQRGIREFEEAKAFFRPSLSMLHDPFKMKDMDQAVDRLALAVSRQERIVVYGDYDVDGTTSVAMMFHFLRSFHPNISYYIPDRHKEGYGVSEAGILRAREENAGLVITLDCGIKSVELISRAKEYGIDFIVCDHHLPGKKLPPAVAVLDPKRNDCLYPFKELSGCGVGFKFIQAFYLNHPDLPVDPLDYLDLVAVSIGADIVPVTGENRILAHFGLARLRENPRPGLQALMHLSGMTEVTMTNVVFRIAPRINSAGRINHAFDAVVLMLAASEEEAASYAHELHEQNQVRKETDELITREALEMIEADSTMISARSTVLFKKDWHKGVIGIVASRCIERYYRPTIILTHKSENLVTGSARSVNGFDVYSALTSCADLLEQFGGHMHAAGMTLREDNVSAFREEFEKVVSRTIREEDLTPEIRIDSGLKFDEITPKFFRIIRQFAPFGPENLNPVFMSCKLKARSVRVLKGKHLKMQVCQEDSGNYFDAIGFGLGGLEDLIKGSDYFNMAYSLEVNHFRGKTSLQLMIQDIKVD